MSHDEPQPSDVTSQSGAGRMYTRLPILIVAITVMALAIGALALRYLEAQLVATKGESLALAAVSAVETLDRLLAERNGDVQLMAQIAEFRNFDPRTVTPYLHQIQAAYPVYLWLGMTDRQGRILAATKPASVGLDRSGQPWFQAARTNQKLSVTDAAPSQEMDGTLAITVSAPLRDSTGAFAGTVVGQVGLPLIETIIVKEALLLQAQARDRQRLEWQLVNRTGEVLIDSHLRQEGRVNLQALHVPSIALAASTTGYIREHHPRREVDVLTGYARTKGTAGSPGLDWTVLVRLDHDTIVAPIWALMWKLNAAGLAVIAPLLGLLLWTTRRLEKEYSRAEQDSARAKVAQLEHQRSEAKFRNLFEFSPDAIVMVNQGGCITLANRQAESLFGYSQAEFLGLPVERLMPESARQGHVHLRQQFLAAATPRMMGTGRPALHALKKDGTTFPVDISLSPIQAETGPLVAATVRDTTLRKQAEQALRESEEHFRILFEQAAVGVAQIDAATGRFVRLNQKYCEITGYSQAEMLALDILQLTHPDDREACRNNLARLRAEEIRECGTEKRYVRKNGAIAWVKLVASPMWQPGAAPDHFIMVVQDITERKEAETALRTLNARLDFLLSSSPAIIYTCEAVPPYAATFVSTNLTEILGYTPEEFLNTPNFWADQIHPDDRDRAFAGLPSLLALGSDLHEYRFQHKDGSWRWMRDALHVVSGPDGKAIELIGYFIDISDRKMIEQSLSRTLDELRALSRRLEVIREEERTRIARELHDELGMRMTCLKMDLSRLQSMMNSEDRATLEKKILSMIEQVDTTLAAIQSLVADLRPGVLDDLGLVAAIEWQCREFERGSGIRCLFESKEEDIRLDSTRATVAFRICQEALTNVVRHANAKEVRVHLNTLDEALILEIHDDGQGILPEKITDAASLGLLGLRERAGAVGGSLRIVGLPGQGTTVTLRVPCE
ncbi:MAG: hypothetical protein RL042_301 [Nitrospirota bacterium]|jgi:PAS domain S-box-containing protein